MTIEEINLLVTQITLDAQNDAVTDLYDDLMMEREQEKQYEMLSIQYDQEFQ